MLEDEENFVKLEAFEQMNTIFIDFHEEDLEMTEVSKVFYDIYSTNNADHCLKEVLDCMVSFAGKFMFKLGTKRLLEFKSSKGDSLADRFLAFFKYVYEKSKQETIKAVKT